MMSSEQSLKQHDAGDYCTHYVMRKKRHCRMFAQLGQKFCGEHQPAVDSKLDFQDSSNIKSKMIRIVCPLDRKHTCYAHNLRKHLKICNARPGVPESYIEKDINSGRSSEHNDDSFKFLSTFPSNEIVQLVEKINRIYEEKISGNITSEISSHEAVEKEMQKPEYGDKIKKHLKQTSSILGLLLKYNLIQPNSCYIEFGAGRGHLSYWLAQVTDSDKSSFLLVERSSPKHKRDNKLDKTDDKVQRIRADIADLVLDKLEVISKTSSVVGVTKHLCGEATDLAIRCLTNVESNQQKVSGCLMTFCCHHRCRWIPYTGKDFFAEVGLSKNDFDMMCGISSWATCGSGFSRKRRKEEEDDEDKTLFNERDKEIGLSRDQKGEVGRKCKSILNWGRLYYLQKMNFKCFLHYYVEADITLENVCIVAFKND